MPKNLMFASEEIRFLRELKKNRVEFMLVGAAAAALQGAPVVTQDVDLWFEDFRDPGIERALKKVGGTLVPSFGGNPPTFAGKSVKLFDVVLTMHGLDAFEKEKKNSFEIKLGSMKVRVLNLDRIIKSKEAVRRPKDLLVLPVLRETLEVIKSRRSKPKS